MNLPAPIQAYFDADKSNDAKTLVGIFAPHAVVNDENRSYAGLQAIESWWREAKIKYQHVTEPFETSGQGDVTSVRATVTGVFPGSPITCTFVFRLDGNQVSRLDIGA